MSRIIFTNPAKWLTAVFLIQVLSVFPGATWAGDCAYSKEILVKARGCTTFACKRDLYLQAVRKCPGDAVVWNNLADAEENTGQLALAIEHYQKASQLNPRLAEPHFGLGDVYLKQGKFEAACKLYLRGLELRPDDALALAGLRRAEAGWISRSSVLPKEYLARRFGVIRTMGIGFRPKAKVAFSNILFAFGSDELLDRSKLQLAEIGSALGEIVKSSSTRFVIEGHTDNVGTAQANQALSLKRARRVVQYLGKRYQIPADRLRAVGYGFRRPVADNRTEEGRSQNRRVEITIGN